MLKTLFHMLHGFDISEEFQKLCPDGIGRGETGQDLDECSLILDLCQGGNSI
jgi:hypothetical protein